MAIAIKPSASISGDKNIVASVNDNNNVKGILPKSENLKAPLPIVHISAKSKISSEHCEPSQNRFVFVYTITINVEGKLAVQLLSRYWKITSADGEVQEVRGEGVIGEQPLILPKQAYSYESFSVLPTPLGWMEGEYQMVDDEGRFFTAIIPQFKLAMPGVLH